MVDAAPSARSSHRRCGALAPPPTLLAGRCWRRQHAPAPPRPHRPHSRTARDVRNERRERRNGVPQRYGGPLRALRCDRHAHVAAGAAGDAGAVQRVRHKVPQHGVRVFRMSFCVVGSAERGRVCARACAQLRACPRAPAAPRARRAARPCAGAGWHRAPRRRRAPACGASAACALFLRQGLSHTPSRGGAAACCAAVADTTPRCADRWTATCPLQRAACHTVRMRAPTPHDAARTRNLPRSHTLASALSSSQHKVASSAPRLRRRRRGLCSTRTRRGRRRCWTRRRRRGRASARP
jgi:hypothetical protein